MRVSDLIKIWTVLDSLDDQTEKAAPGDQVEVPKIKGLKVNGKRFTLKDAVLECED